MIKRFVVHKGEGRVKKPHLIINELDTKKRGPEHDHELIEYLATPEGVVALEMMDDFIDRLFPESPFEHFEWVTIADPLSGEEDSVPNEELPDSYTLQPNLEEMDAELEDIDTEKGIPLVESDSHKKLVEMGWTYVGAFRSGSPGGSYICDEFIHPKWGLLSFETDDDDFIHKMGRGKRKSKEQVKYETGHIYREYLQWFLMLDGGVVDPKTYQSLRVVSGETLEELEQVQREIDGGTYGQPLERVKPPRVKPSPYARVAGFSKMPEEFKDIDEKVETQVAIVKVLKRMKKKELKEKANV